MAEVLQIQWNMYFNLMHRTNLTYCC